MIFLTSCVLQLLLLLHIFISVLRYFNSAQQSKPVFFVFSTQNNFFRFIFFFFYWFWSRSRPGFFSFFFIIFMITLFASTVLISLFKLKLCQHWQMIRKRITNCIYCTNYCFILIKHPIDLSSPNARIFQLFSVIALLNHKIIFFVNFWKI